MRVADSGGVSEAKLAILAALCVADSGDAPEAKLAILAEGFVVERAMLTQSPTERVTDFVPASVRNFAHSRAKWELTDK